MAREVVRDQRVVDLRTGRTVKTPVFDWPELLSLAAAVWLYTYREWEIIEHTDPTGRIRLLPSERVRMQPWWDVYATVALIFVGAGISLWLLPERRRLIERLAASFVKTP